MASMAAFVASCVALTLTPGITPPAESRTTPVIPPVVVWAAAGMVAPAKISATIEARKPVRPM